LLLKISSGCTVPIPVPIAVAVNITPAVLADAPIKVKSCVPNAIILYDLPIIIDVGLILLPRFSNEL
jgi:hypothetical protein